ncbi:diadenosine tetraphosphate (Ap4A) HIT family hydrolase [Alkalispirillum mobile]|uniref:Diadenosine tetraphosphate (Ap4A) HIT family hydrolase n=1 Tax=Alkalispirillum mobile TaxID=85925 RepID=A0A498BZZ9_9GAMM|nr:HIT family protein [Alkalispirillum mobile]RLK48369.1 diadenosine tetraphosphate (Ap4A) HIT family hydrolase [Alkalispirillum mobile]
MATELDAFREKFQVDALSVAGTEHWVLSVRPQQLTLGSMVLSTRANVLDFASLSEAQSRDMAHLFGEAERRVKTLFGAARINALCLMMRDPLLHFHIFPRYENKVAFAGQDWIDADWPKPPQIRPVDEDPEINRALRDALRGGVGS